MMGITSYGAYVPAGRLGLAEMAGQPAREGGPERSVAGFDEDAITMAVAAANDCLVGVDRGSIDAVFFASTTAPYSEKQAASIVAKALGLRFEARVADFGGSLRAGTTALQCALDAVSAGSARSVLVVASDCRMAAPGSAMERNFGDGAAALLVGDTAPMALITESHSITDEILDVWRVEGDAFVSTWEERFVVQHGYLEYVADVVGELMEKLGTKPGDFSHVAFYAPDARSHAAAVRALGFEGPQVEDSLFGRLGNCGAAFAPLLLVAALEQSAPGDPLLVASYGDGAEALAIEVIDKGPGDAGRLGVRGSLARRRPLASYNSYLASRNLAPGQPDRGAGAGISATVHYRERDADIGFWAGRCVGCGTLHFPVQRVCYSCYARDDFEPVRLADKSGKVMSYTFDYFFPTPEPPLIATMIETEGGCRVYLQMADADADEMRCDLPVEFVFRKIHEAGGKPNYFWKCTPTR
jgi:hydroxymethylglutaryl-CoA synthase